MVVNKEKHKELLRALNTRYSKLVDVLEGRELTHSSEGVKGRGSWLNPEEKAVLAGTDLEITLALDDFKAVLGVLRRLK